MRLATMMLLTPDLAEARRFYGDVLGFGVVSESPDLLVLDHQGAAFHVFRCESPAPEQRHGRDAATVLVFGVDSIDATMAELRAKGVEFVHATPASNAFGRYAGFRAPGGLVHELLEASA